MPPSLNKGCPWVDATGSGSSDVIGSLSAQLSCTCVPHSACKLASGWRNGCTCLQYVRARNCSMTSDTLPLKLKAKNPEVLAVDCKDRHAHCLCVLDSLYEPVPHAVALLPAVHAFSAALCDTSRRQDSKIPGAAHAFRHPWDAATLQRPQEMTCCKRFRTCVWLLSGCTMLLHCQPCFSVNILPLQLQVLGASVMETLTAVLTLGILWVLPGMAMAHTVLLEQGIGPNQRIAPAAEVRPP